MVRHGSIRPGLSTLAAAVLVLSAGWVAGPARAAQPNRAGEKRAVEITLHVPEDATVWIDGNQTTSTGTTRLFACPPIPAGRNYSYEVRVRWTEEGRTVERKRQLSFQAGDHITLDLASGTVSVQGYERLASVTTAAAPSQTTPAVRSLPYFSPNVPVSSGGSSEWSGPAVVPSSQMDPIQSPLPLW
jgi:uncharacterized protein (TIGR03000 family)